MTLIAKEKKLFMGKEEKEGGRKKKTAGKKTFFLQMPQQIY